jgi:membrane-associated phospholipid phosphatase
MKPAWALLAIALLSCPARTARADDTSPPNGSPYRLRIPYDFAILSVSAGLSLSGVIGFRPATCPDPCVAPQNQLGIDDAAVGLRSSAAMVTSNVLLATTLAIPIVADAIDSRFHGWAEDMVVILESVALSTALTQVAKSATARPAPLVYAPDVTAGDLRSPDAARSFPSGHTAATFAAATAYALTFWKRHPDSPWRFVVLVAGEALAVTTGVMTIPAGWHYPTDVLAGALIGTSMGVLMPVLHSEW